MASLLEDIAAYEERRDYLEVEFFGKWVVFYEGELAGSYDDFQEAAADAVGRFGRGPYLIRQVGAPPMQLPASVQYKRVDANG